MRNKCALLPPGLKQSASPFLPSSRGHLFFHTDAKEMRRSRRFPLGRGTWREPSQTGGERPEKAELDLKTQPCSVYNAVCRNITTLRTVPLGNLSLPSTILRPRQRLNSLYTTTADGQKAKAYSVRRKRRGRKIRHTTVAVEMRVNNNNKNHFH